MKPCGNYILIEPIQESKLITPKKARKSSSKGLILEIGNYTSKDIKVGQMAYFSPQGAKKTEFGLLIPERSLNLSK